MIGNTFTRVPQTYARIAGLLGLYIVFAGIFAEAFVRGGIIVSGDGAATAANILASESLYRTGAAVELLMLVADIALAFVLFVLLKPVDRNLSLLAAFLRGAVAIISGVKVLIYIAPLIILSGADYFSAFSADQLNALVMLALRVQTFGYHIALVFFGFYLLIIGWLIMRAPYLPAIFGFMLLIAAGCYLTNSFANILALDFAGLLFPYILLPPLIAESGLTLWLLIMGVNGEKWRDATGER